MRASPSSGEPGFDIPAMGAGDALRPYLLAIRSHLLLVGAAILIAGLGAGIWTMRKAPTYEATSKILISPIPEEDLNLARLPLLRSSNDTARVVQTAASILNSRSAADAAAAKLGGRTGADVENSVDLVPEETSNVVSVTATDDTGHGAAELANAYAQGSLDARWQALQPLLEDQLAEAQSEIDKLKEEGAPAAQARQRLASLQTLQEGGRDPTLSITQRATVPKAALGFPSYVVVALAMLAGLTLGSAAAVLIEYLTARRIGDESDLLQIYPLPILARVPEARSVGTASRPAAGIREGYRTLRGRLEYQGGAADDGSGFGSLVLVSADRGDGRTTSTLELARALSAPGSVVTAIDLDLRNPGLADLMEASPGPTLSAAIVAGGTLADGISGAHGVSGIELIAAPPDADLEMIETAGREARRLIAEAQARSGAVIVDTPAIGQVSDAIPLLGVVDRVVVVVRIGTTTVAGLTRLREAMEIADIAPNGYLVIGSAMPIRLAPGGGRRADPVPVA